MNDDGWYTSFVGSSGKPFSAVQKLAQRSVKRRDTILEGEPSVTAVPKSEKSLLAVSKPQPYILSSPNVVRKVKSYSEFETISRSHIHKIHEIKEKSFFLDNEVDFDSWFLGEKEELVNVNQEQYQIYLEQLQDTESYLDSLLKTADNALATLSELTDSFRAVETQTTEFQSQCEDILSDQKRTSTIADDVAENLQYYNYLEPITKRLNAPGAGNLVRRQEFPEILSNLDACLEYMTTNSKQKEASNYATKYRLLMTRSLTLIRNHFSSAIKDIASDVSKRLADRQLNDTTMSALLYAKFRVGAPEMKKLGQEIQKRAIVAGNEGEYQGLMNEIFQTYSSIRGKLLLPIIHKKLADIAAAPSTKELVAFARSSINFLRGLCSDEHQLWTEWFDSGSELYPFLETLCEPLYDHLRPRTIRETKLMNLCELCTLIQSRYMEDSDSEPDSEPDSMELDFARLIQTALHDAQDRLVFLAQVSLRNDIQYFKPKPEHLDYPRRASRVALSGTRTTTSTKKSNGTLSPLPKNPIVVEEDGVGRDFLFEPGTGEYYPTLRKAVWLLSRIYRLIQSTVFDSLAHEIVHQTILSLIAASNQISPRVSPTDASLFLLSHLLTFKHHILAFDIEFAAPDVQVDFATSATSIWQGLDLSSLFSPSKLVRAVGAGLVPRVTTEFKDARTDVDERLRLVIGELVTTWANRIAEPLSGNSSKISNGKGAAQQHTRRKSSVSVNPEESAAAKSAGQVRSAIEREVPLIRKKMDEYIHDRRTRDMLLRAVLEAVMVKYTAWLDGSGLGNSKVGKRANKGKGREDGVWEEEAFGDWAVRAFGLDVTGEEDDDDDDDDDDDLDIGERGFD